MYKYKQLFLHIIAEIEAYRVRPGSSIYWRKKELDSFSIHYGKSIWVGRNLSILNSGKIILGDHCALGDNTQLINFSQIIVGNDFLSANDLSINSGTHDSVTLSPISKNILIGDRVWCGTRVTIVAGVSIGSDVVIGAGSVVTNDIPSNCVVAGVPARIIRKLYRNKKEPLWSWS